MLNIISRSIVSPGTSGPKKVVINLIKGLDILGYPYCINKALDATSQLWIHDDPVALKAAAKMKLKAIVGPNIYINPRNIPENIDMSSFVYIHPSPMVVSGWLHFGFDRCRLDAWPVGIDTREFREREKPENGIVLVYFKQRYPEELDFVKKILEKEKIQYEIIAYRFYKQSDYLKKLHNTRYMVWLGRQESQGIALEEALSMNVPMLVWDVVKGGHWVPTRREQNVLNKEESDYPAVTSAYYFNDQCGIKIVEKDEIEKSIQIMEKSWKSFEPRNYILENLSLEKQARTLIELFNKYYTISYETGKSESLKSAKKWRNDRFYFKIYMFMRNQAKKVYLLSFGQ